ncbi:MAG: zinc ribbon domain-containing protein [Candidatus Helarchaeota archaeon]|nr:zinc ribbon domain-containing protein [Candidatus Helarchaeota archaeon]
MEEQPVRSGGSFSEWCCFILAALLVVMQYYVYGTIDPLSIYFLIFVVFLIFISMYNRLTLRRKVYSHLLNFSNSRVPIQNIMKDLQIGFFDVMYILGEIQNKKKIPIEIIEKTGEVEVGQVGKKIKAIPQSKEEDISKPPISDEDIKKEGMEEIKNMYKCSNCGREMGEVYKYCPGCGRPLKKID